MNKKIVKLAALAAAAVMLLSSCVPAGTTAAVGTPGTTAGQTTPGTQATTAGTVATTEQKTLPNTPLVDEYDGTLTEAELRDKVLGGWIGQMAGVAFFAKTEFGASGQMMTAERVNKLYSEWESGIVSINDAFDQDDTYVEIPFMDAMKENGALCGLSPMAEKFKNSQFALWHANKVGRDNLLAGLTAPESGHFLYNQHCDDLDWQIECDFLGMMYPGLVNAAAKRSFDIGHITNYGDGVYGGVFVTAMHSAAFTANTVGEIVKAGLAVIPDNTTFKEAMNLVVESYLAGDEWWDCWNKLEAKYGTVDKCPEMSTKKYNIDAKLNAAYILVGLLWGGGDFEQTMIIAGKCGQDSDCNPSSAASILGNMYGASGIPEMWKKGLNYDTRKFSATEYTLNDVVDLNVALMKEVLVSEGATQKDGVWTIAKDTNYSPVKWEQWTDEFDAGLVVTNKGAGTVALKLVTNGPDPVKSVKLEMPDGKVYDCMVAQYTFPESGEYTIKYTVTSKSGVKVEKTRTFTVGASASVDGTPICSVTNPTGGGNKDMSVMFDGYTPYVSDTDSALQYDTYDGGAAKDSVYVGITFKKTTKISGIDFTEGKHFGNGGWFASKPDIEVLIGGEWKKAESKISRVYPEGNTLASHGNNFDIYTFTFDEVECDGVRLIGKPGGTAYFISVGELTPHVKNGGEKVTFDNADVPNIVCGTTNPTGGGNKNIAIIADGVKGSGGSQQYDTYAGVRPDTAEYFGYIYKEKVTVTGIEYTEGAHSGDGGWFKDGSLKVEALIGGVWTEVASNASSVYPNGNKQSAFGVAYETFNIALNAPVECEGIRIAGIAGGTSGWVGVSELTVKTAK